METGDLFWILCSFLECFWTHSMHSLIFVKERRKGGIKKKRKVKKKENMKKIRKFTLMQMLRKVCFSSPSGM